MVGVGWNNYTRFIAKTPEPTQDISSYGEERGEKERTELYQLLV